MRYKGQFVKGEHYSPSTEFKKGEHWRSEQPFWDRDWLLDEYLTKGHSSHEIAESFGVTEGAILFWMRKHGIKRRTISEVRKVKHWGADGCKNPMFGKLGKQNPHYKHGLTPERQSLYSKNEWKQVCKIVRERDKNVCKKCGIHISGRNKHIHHIKPFKSDISERTNPENLITVCSKCHGFIHSKNNINHELLH
jgi:5-methylcytosine-specific restriction protein A